MTAITIEGYRMAGLARHRTLVVAGLASVVATLLYLATGQTGSGGDQYIPLAGALLHGTYYVDERPWLEQVPTAAGFLSPFPLAPVLFYLPIVAVMGVQPPSAELGLGVVPAILGGLSVGLAYVLLRWRLAVAERPALWISAGFATTTLWWAAGIGGTHLMAQVSAVLFLLAALYVALGRERPVLAGLLFALAVGSRLPVGLALPLFVYLYRGRSWRFVAGALPVAALVGLYNVARFGSPFDFGYARIVGAEGPVTADPWFALGIESPAYIPRGIAAAFLSWPQIVGDAPFVKPSLFADSLLLTAPFLGWVVLARGRLAAVAAASAALVLVVDLMHGTPGFAQFGYRFILDSMPLLLVVLGVAMRDRVPSAAFRVAIVLGAIVTAYGFWAWSAGFTMSWDTVVPG